MRQIVSLAAGAVVLLAQPVIAGSEREIPDGPVAPRVARLLEDALGDPDPGALRRLAAQLSTDEIAVALYRGDRGQRLTALEICGYLSSPWPALPYLVAFMGARERQSASRAAHSLLTALEDAASLPGAPPDVVGGQLNQLGTQLERIALDERLELDLRVAAIAALGMLAQLGGERRPPAPELFEDPEAAIRAAALGMLDPPLADDRLPQLVDLAGADQDLALRGQAAALLCENALAHGVERPTPDLAKLLGAVIGGAGMPAEGVAPILACLRRFSPEARADLVSAALGHADPRVQAFWEELEQQ